MSESFLLGDGAMVLRDAAGVKKFDTDEEMYHTLTLDIDGSRSFAARSSTGAAINETNTFLIGTCNPFCQHIVGQVRTNLATGHGIPFDRWTTIDIGGEIIWSFTGPGLAQNSAGLMTASPHTLCKYRFYNTAGNVYLQQRLIMPNAANTYILNAHTLTWRLEGGRYN